MLEYTETNRVSPLHVGFLDRGHLKSCPLLEEVQVRVLGTQYCRLMRWNVILRRWWVVMPLSIHPLGGTEQRNTSFPQLFGWILVIRYS
jgi:hypothetical protein